MGLPSFDDMLKLAQNNPEQLEQLRQQLVSNLISSAPQAYQRRLRGLQFQIDAERQIASNPMSSCIRISKMMHDCLFELKQVIEPETQKQPPSRSSAKQAASEIQSAAQILPFAVRA
ncbi:DUF3135 domain-containing protein [Bacterioplanoides sp. SCSIO 12839]|uniref:DUF3135 domain-containing protein n=1 Tax=Bacterioplanoides sp. SCSIO 12839 TaxID=2829569 RepID=UPI002105164B|nr:DUF3135 domain-containing protein [Bacterioplanoides sp. SCSIO 12839]UTW49865.1 DUF3135 domain-containing protein [Bacterioplanoides sp. SCSIO 12839]